MFDHSWFSYWHNIFQNVTLEDGWPWLIFILRQPLSQCDVGQSLAMVDFHIDIIFFTMRRWTMVGHSWPWLSKCDVRPWYNISHNVTMLINHGWPWLTIIDHGWPWFISILRKSLSQYDGGPWLTMVNSRILVDNKWPWSTMLEQCGPWLTMDDND